jgi:hypothetical protein
VGPHIAAVIDFVHALAMVAWVMGLPVLFLRSWPRARRWYAVYALTFIILSKGSQWLLGACFLTRLSTILWNVGAPHRGDEPETWFTVRFAERIFHLRPSEDAVVLAWDVALAVSCAGLLVHLRRARALARVQRTDKRAPSAMVPADTR